ncbi:MAG: rhomboid family intramembrane serine protease [Bdellovibrionales bacterium]|nr:rhomboid family intramembrane serine protease [Bdellovibrionales bacterium]
MIIPLINGWLSFTKIPMTWLLIFINSGVFISSYFSEIKFQRKMDQILEDEQFIFTQGQIYSQYLLDPNNSYSNTLQSLAQRAQKGDRGKFTLLGNLSLRDQNFLDRSHYLEFSGDQVQIKHWRSNLTQLKNMQDLHFSYILGLTSNDQSHLQQWVSYIFVHSGPYHFFGNMYFLLVFGSFLEPLIGGLALLILFLSTGMMAAACFILISGATAAPLIGASGAISGLMTFFTIFYWHHPVRFMYFILPSTRYVGFIFLPAWVLFAIFFISDLSGYLSTVTDLGGVAYAAHLGGDFAAMIMGASAFLIHVLLRKFDVAAFHKVRIVEKFQAPYPFPPTSGVTSEILNPSLGKPYPLSAMIQDRLTL